MAFAFKDLVDAVETYPQSFVKIEIIEVDFPGDALNVGEIGTFTVKVTNTGALTLDNVTVKVKGVNDALVKDQSALAQFKTDFVTQEFDRIGGHGGYQTLPSSKLSFKAPKKAHSLTDLIEVSLQGWNASLDHILIDHSIAVDSVKGTFAAKVVKL
jgi:hypothetical protein